MLQATSIIADTDHLTVEVLAGSTAGSTYSLGGGAVWTPGDLYVIAGGGTSAPNALGTSADDADLPHPSESRRDAVGNLVVADRADDEVEILAVSSSDPGYFLGSGATWTPGDLYVLAGGGDQTPSASGTDGLLTLLEPNGRRRGIPFRRRCCRRLRGFRDRVPGTPPRCRPCSSLRHPATGRSRSAGRRPRPTAEARSPVTTCSSLPEGPRPRRRPSLSGRTRRRLWSGT